jgi:hypothetical protein
LNRDTDPPLLANERIDIDEPMCFAFNTLKLSPILAELKMLKLLPRRAIFRTLKELPIDTNSRIEVALPKRPKLRSDKLEAKLMNANIDTFAEYRVLPVTDKVLPKREKALRDTQLPTCNESTTLILCPAIKRPRTERLDPRCTKLSTESFTNDPNANLP